jgi:hypothetical protein
MIPAASSALIDATIGRDDRQIDAAAGTRNTGGALSGDDAPSIDNAGSPNDGDSVGAAVPAADAGAPGAPVDTAPNDSLASDTVRPSVAGHPASDPAAAARTARLYWFERDIDRKVERYRRDGKDPHDLFDPSKPDYLGTPEALAPYTGRGPLWLASNTGDNSAGRAPPGQTVEPENGARTNSANQAPPVSGSPEPSEAAAAEAARAAAAERIARFVRSPHPEPDLLLLSIALASVLGPEIPPAALGSEGAAAVFGPEIAAALRQTWPTIKEIWPVIAGFARSGQKAAGVDPAELFKEIQQHLNTPSATGQPAAPNGEADAPSALKTVERSEALPPTPEEADLKAARQRIIDANLGERAAQPAKNESALAPGRSVGTKIGDEVWFSTFGQLKRQFGPAGPGQVWHHLVEQARPKP